MRIAVLLLCLIACFANAETEKKPKPLSLDAELGLISTTGNTQTKSLATKLDVKQELSSWRTHYLFQSLYKQDKTQVVENGETVTKNKTSAQRFYASSQADYKLDEEHKGIFIFLSYEHDRFSGFDYQSTVAAGYSDRLFETEKSFMDYSVGPGVAYSRTSPYIDKDGNLVESENQHSAVMRLAFAYEHQFSDTAKFTQTLSADVALQGNANTKSKSETALTANLTKSFALKASYLASHNSVVPDDKKNLDTQTALTFVYSY